MSIYAYLERLISEGRIFGILRVPCAPNRESSVKREIHFGERPLSFWDPAAVNKMGTILEAPAPISKKPTSAIPENGARTAVKKPAAAQRPLSTMTLLIPQYRTTRSPVRRPMVMAPAKTAYPSPPSLAVSRPLVVSKARSSQALRPLPGIR
jgi:hypothetical protein